MLRVQHESSREGDQSSSAVNWALLNPRSPSNFPDRTRELRRKSGCVNETRFGFAERVARLAQTYSDAGLLKSSPLTGNGFAGWNHVVLHHLRIQ